MWGGSCNSPPQRVKSIYLWRQKELEALLWICFTSDQMLSIFWPIFFFGSKKNIFKKSVKKVWFLLWKFSSHFLTFFENQNIFPRRKKSWKKNSSKIINILPRVKHTESRASNSLWAPRTDHMKIHLGPYPQVCVIAL